VDLRGARADGEPCCTRTTRHSLALITY
jgi:hypothetical protein